MRRASREYVFKLVFEFTFYGGVNDDTLELFLTDADLTDEDREYIRECYYGVISGMDRLKAKLGSRLERFTVDRLYRPDMVVLLIALYELERGDTPAKSGGQRGGGPCQKVRHGEVGRLRQRRAGQVRPPRIAQGAMSAAKKDGL